MCKQLKEESNVPTYNVGIRRRSNGDTVTGEGEGEVERERVGETDSQTERNRES